MIDKKFVQSKADECIQELDTNLYVVELTITPSNAITIELDKEDGYVSIDECIAISRKVERSLDRDADDFELMVTSAGLDKPLRHPRQFQKNIGREVKVKFNDGKTTEGVLKNADEEQIVLTREVTEIEEGKKKKVKKEIEENFAFSMIKEVKIVIKFK